MYTIQLTDEPGWDAPTLQARAIKMTVDLAKVVALAADWLHEAQQDASYAHKPDGWRIVNGIGRRVKTSEVSADAVRPNGNLRQPFDRLKHRWLSPVD
jgi:hypothetical protein